MPHPILRRARAWLPGFLVLCGTVAASEHAAAQSLDLVPPTITISPGSGTYSAGPRSVTINWSDNYALDHGSRVITYNGADVTAAFSYSSNSVSASSSGTVTVGTGSQALVAYICDANDAPNCRTVTATYTGPAPSVRVTPEATALSVVAGVPAATRYRVVNTGSGQTTFTTIATCPTSWGCAPSVPTVVLAAGDSAFVDMAFTAPAPATGWVQLSAASGSVSSFGGLNVTALAAADPGFPGDDRSLQRIQRDACVSILVGPASASECGDLRVVHALPETRVLNRVRVPVLVYNSGTARPLPIAAMHLAGPVSGTPDSIRAVLQVNGAQGVSKRWKGWGSSQTRRVALSFDASNAASYPTGVYTYTLQVTAEWLSGTQQVLATRTGRMIIVNRAASPFGAGWWLAGLEQLVTLPGDTARLWVGGDGSARIYHGNPGGPWVADDYARPDTLYRAVRPEVGEVTVRTLPGRSEVWFDNLGRHLRTVSPLQHYTAFRWSGNYVVQLNLPYTSTQGDTTRYLFEYNNNPTATVRNLNRVVAPGTGVPRYTVLATDATGRVTRITDPDSTYVGFTYSNNKWMNTRTDRLGAPQTFVYQGPRFFSSSRPVSPTQNALTRVTSSFVQGAYGYSQAVDSVQTIYDGPRTDLCDCTWWHTDRYGAPIDMRNGLQQVTLFRRGDPRWPAVVTQVVAPNGFTTTATYDARGNPASSTAWNPYGDGRNATTTYQFDPYWDAPAQVVSPEGETVSVGYDARGKLWEQPGSDPVRRVTYAYYPANDPRAPGLMERVTHPSGAAERYEYDARGNLEAVVSPRNGIRTEYLNDALGRVVRTRVPAESSPGVTAGWLSDSTVYNTAGQVVYSVTSGPEMNNVPAQQLHVRREPDAEGRLKWMERWSTPDLEFTPIGAVRTSWRYDLSGRVVAEVAPDGMVDSVTYDLGGNPTELHGRRSDPVTGARLVVRTSYDHLNRPLTRQIPQVTYAARDQGIPQKYRSSAAVCTGDVLLRTYPHLPNDGGCGLRIDAQTETFAYDNLGNVTTADNADARVRRTYYPGGALATDSLRIRTTTGTDFSTHAYGLAYQYDRNGRRTQLSHPAQLAPAPGQSTVRYGYDPATGGLASVTDPMGNQFTYDYNPSGQLQRRSFVGVAWDQFEYQADGTLWSFASYLQNQTLRYATFTHDAAGRILEVRNQVGQRDSVSVRYSGLGHAISTYAQNHNDATSDPTWFGRERFSYDAMGNMVNRYGFNSSKGTDTRYESYVDGTSGFDNAGRLGGTSVIVRTTSPNEPGVTRRDESLFDAAGNVVFGTQQYQLSGSCSSQAKADADCEDRASFYGADGRLRAADHRVRLGTDNGGYSRSTFEEYRYDALGRRVWVRSRLTCPGWGAPVTQGWPLVPCYSTIRRTVWDGGQELWEIQMPGSDTSSYLENDVAPVPVRQYVGWYPDPQYNQPGIYDPSLFSWYDPNPLHGRVAYTHGLAVDQPLSLVRIGLNRYYPATYPNTAGTGVSFAPFAAMPLWDWRGQMAGAVYAGGAREQCQIFAGVSRCAGIATGGSWSAYSSHPMPAQWHGTLVMGKTDAAGTQYRRARYYDPSTGRFTQEDPIGLAGGINLYGYAGGDPVNLSDPGGNFPVLAITALIGAGIGIGVGGYIGYQRGGLGGMVLGGLGGGAAGALTGAGLGAAAVGLGLLPAAVGGGATGSVIVGEISLSTIGIEATTAEVITGTAVPVTFKVTTALQQFYVPVSATEKLSQWLTRAGSSIWSAPVRGQVLLQSFQGAVEQAAAQGIVYGQRMLVGGWELVFELPRVAGNLPVIIHAVPKM